MRLAVAKVMIKKHPEGLAASLAQIDVKQNLGDLMINSQIPKRFIMSKTLKGGRTLQKMPCLVLLYVSLIMQTKLDDDCVLTLLSCL